MVFLIISVPNLVYFALLLDYDLDISVCFVNTPKIQNLFQSVGLYLSSTMLSMMKRTGDLPEQIFHIQFELAFSFCPFKETDDVQESTLCPTLTPGKVTAEDA